MVCFHVFLHQVPVNKFSVTLGHFLGLYQNYTLRTKWLEQLAKWFHGRVVSALDYKAGDPGSIPGSGGTID